MRRETKLGIFITLSAGLVVAVLTGRAITNGGPAKESRVALSVDKSVDKDAADILEALQQDSAHGTSSQAARPQDAVDALVAELPPARHDLSAPVSANDEMKRYLEGGKNASANSDVADILDILDKTSGAGTAKASSTQSGAPAVAQSASHMTAADISVSAGSSSSTQGAQAGAADKSAVSGTSSAPKTVPPAVSSTVKSSMPSSDMSTLDRLEKAALASEPAARVPAPVEAPKKDTAMDYLTRIENKTLGVQQEGTTTYKVKSGDSFWYIAEKFYGSGARFNDIAKANPSVKSTELSIGTVLTIPLDKPKTAAVSPSSAPALSTSSTVDSSQKTYKVQEGDSFWSIASKMLGGGVEWEKIARANPSINPDNLKVGSMLVIP